MVYRDDLNNDGSLEYVVVILDMGSGENGGVYGAYFLKEKLLVSLKFEETVMQNMFPRKEAPSMS